MMPLHTRTVYKIDALYMALKKNVWNFHSTRDTVVTFCNEPLSNFQTKKSSFCSNCTYDLGVTGDLKVIYRSFSLQITIFRTASSYGNS